jgi:hypothetical protein
MNYGGEWLYSRRRRNKERMFRFSVNSNPSRVILPPKQVKLGILSCVIVEWGILSGEWGH